MLSSKNAPGRFCVEKIFRIGILAGMEFSLDDISRVAELVIQRARQAKLAAPDRATVVALSGDLGAGKTTLVKEIARILGVSDELQSPTYVIYKRYEVPNDPDWKSLIHGDMYRLESADDIKKLGWDEMVAEPGNLIVVEWPEMIGDAVPQSAVCVLLTHKSDSLRSIDYN